MVVKNVQKDSESPQNVEKGVPSQPIEDINEDERPTTLNELSGETSTSSRSEEEKISR